MRVVQFLLLAGMLCAADKRGVTPEDYFLFANVGDPQISPDGRTVAYTITRVDEKQNRRNSEIWLAAVDGNSPPRQLTTGPSSTSPRWAPDGYGIAFLSARPLPDDTSPKQQVHLLSMQGGEARRITSLKNGVSALAWAPDRARLGCVLRAGAGDLATHTEHL